MRDFLVTKLCCYECGRPLELTYDEPKRKASDYCDGEPTGAHMVQVKVSVMPCQCLRSDIDGVRRAVKALAELAASGREGE